MTKLKTLKDMKDCDGDNNLPDGLKKVFKSKLKSEAVKWVKDLRKYKQRFVEAHFLEFMNIEEADLQEKK